MLRNVFWFVTIALALTAIVAGYRSTRTVSVPRAARATTRDPRRATPADRAQFRADGPSAAVNDSFARDPVTVAHSGAAGVRWRRERLLVMVVGIGWSLPLESAFLASHLPLGFVIDPSAPYAIRAAALARAAGRSVYLQVARAPSPGQLAQLHVRFGRFAGVASRAPAGMARALQGAGLEFFDERGTADPAAFARAGVPLLQRAVTADDRTQPGYVRFMLRRAADVAQRFGPTVVLVRPFPTTLRALQALDGRSGIELVAPR